MDDLEKLKSDLHTANVNWRLAENDLERTERKWDKALAERDEARAECSGLQVALRAAERENAELRARVETCERERSYDLANECIADNQRDEARAALAALLDGLGRDDNPRREAIDKARALDVWWALRDRAKQRGESAEEWLAYVEFVHAREAGR